MRIWSLRIRRKKWFRCQLIGSSWEKEVRRIFFLLKARSFMLWSQSFECFFKKILFFPPSYISSIEAQPAYTLGICCYLFFFPIIKIMEIIVHHLFLGCVFIATCYLKSKLQTSYKFTKPTSKFFKGFFSNLVVAFCVF